MKTIRIPVGYVKDVMLDTDDYRKIAQKIGIDMWREIDCIGMLSKRLLRCNFLWYTLTNKNPLFIHTDEEYEYIYGLIEDFLLSNGEKRPTSIEPRFERILWANKNDFSFVTPPEGGDYIEISVQNSEVRLWKEFDSKPFWSAGEAAEELGYSIQRINQLAAGREIPGSFKNRSGWQIPSGWIEEKGANGKEKPGPKPKKNI